MHEELRRYRSIANAEVWVAFGMIKEEFYNVFKAYFYTGENDIEEGIWSDDHGFSDISGLLTDKEFEAELKNWRTQETTSYRFHRKGRIWVGEYNDMKCLVERDSI